MQALSANDYRLFTSLVKLSPPALLKLLNKYISKKYSEVIYTEDYLMAFGDIPIAVVAHVDTVFDALPKDIYYDREKGVLWSPQGLGADDRAGVFAILKLLQLGLRPTVIFTTDEEIGGVGAEKLVKDFPDCPIKELKYIIQLDRRGTNDCVFYDCDNDDFVKYVESFGFIQNFGSFSDISVLCPTWGVAGVNLSIGYEDEHTFCETLHINPWYSTIKKVKNMLMEEEIPFFEYIENLAYYWRWGYKSDYMTNYSKCDGCGKYFADYELIPAFTKKRKTKYYCPDCCVDHVDWCDTCGSAFQKHLAICPKCGIKKETTVDDND